MTAPDVNADVRARFEVAAWQCRIKPDSGKWTAWEYFDGAVDYDNDRARFPDRVGRWECEYRPLYTHADLAGEVRELKLVIEGLSQYSHNAQEVRELVEALQKLAAYPLEEFALEEKPERKLFGANDWELHAKDVLDARAALAKFHPTHPEE